MCAANWPKRPEELMRVVTYSEEDQRNRMTQNNPEFLGSCPVALTTFVGY